MRLIDADELKEVMCRSAVDTREKIKNKIDNAPTVNDCPNCEYKLEADYIRSSSSYKELMDLRKFKETNTRPQGEWKITEAYPHKVYCSVCYKTFADSKWEVWKDGSLPRAFCPNCGARMGGTT